MFLAYIRLIFRGSFVEITTNIFLVYKILKKPLDVFGYWYLYRSCCFHCRLVRGLFLHVSTSIGHLQVIVKCNEEFGIMFY
jgi:hypothetical protein